MRETSLRKCKSHLVKISKSHLSVFVGVALGCLLSSCTLDFEVRDKNSQIPSNNSPPGGGNPEVQKLNYCLLGDYTKNNQTQIFRSVGTTNKALATGGTDLMKIENSLAHFSSDLPLNIGVGDVIQFDRNLDGTPDELVFIYCRESASSYIVKTASGSAPNDLNLNAHWQIYRAYDSLANAEIGDENDALADSIEDFDTWTDGKDLVASGEQWNIACYDDDHNANTADELQLTIDDWVTSEENYLKIYTPVAFYEVGTSQRHLGFFNPSQGYLVRGFPSNDNMALTIRIPYVHIDGLMFFVYNNAVRFQLPGGGKIWFSNNVLSGGLATGYTNSGLLLEGAPSATVQAYVWNNVSINRGSNGYAFHIDHTNYRAYLFNNASIGSGQGVRFSAGTVTIKNHLSYGNTDNYFVGLGTIDPTSTNNLSGPVQTDAPGSNPQNAATVNFAQPTDQWDYRLSQSDTSARRNGIDLTNDSDFPINQDILSLPRVGTWDIGPYQSSSHNPVTPTYPTNGSNLLDWVLTGTDSPCVATVSTDCEHGGELKSFQLPVGYNTCTDLKAIDRLEVFSWVCDDSTNPVTFRTIGFQGGRGISDIVGSPNSGFLSNAVIVYQKKAPILSSTLSQWWTNPIAHLPIDNTNHIDIDGVDDDGGGGPDEVFAEGTIFFVDPYASTDSAGVNFNLDRIALVNPGGMATLNYSGVGSTNCNVAGNSGGGGPDVCLISGNHHFQWFEGILNGHPTTTVDFLLLLYASEFSTFRNIHFTYSSENCFLYNAISRSRSYNLDFSQCDTAIYASSTSTPGTFENIRIRDSLSYGMILSIDNASFYDVEIVNSIANNGLTVNGTNNTVFENIRIINSGDNGIYSYVSDNNVYQNLYISNSQSDAILLDGNSNNSLFTNLLLTNNNSNGITAYDSDNNTFHSITIANNNEGFEVSNDNNSFALINMLSANNLSRGLAFFSNNNSIEVHNSGFVHNDRNIFIDPTGNNVQFHGYLIEGSPSSTSCTINGASNLSDNAGTCETADMNLALHLNSDATNSFLGRTRSDFLHPQITSLDASGLLAFTSILNWSDFDNWNKSWGFGGAQASAMDSTNRGDCRSGDNCAVWDWRLRLDDTVLFNRSGDGLNTNELFTPENTCPASVHGDQSITANARSFLLNALELSGDNLGNDNGLCENNEACVYAPNIGHYQGAGNPLKQAPCTFVNGTVSGVIMYAHPLNGETSSM